MTDVVLGQDEFEGYVNRPFCSGSFIGRVANRIGGAAFSLGNKTYHLEPNDRGNCLHGGSGVYAGKNFRILASAEDFVTLSILDTGEGGFPGQVHVMVTYKVTDENALEISYMAAASEDTPLNFTNHTYFNMGGHDCKEALSHEIQINASFYTVTDDTNLPTGEIKKVEGTPLDFRKPVRLGTRLQELERVDKEIGGFDHNYVIDGSGMRLAAKVHDPASGRTMQVFTDQPGMQFYTANHFDGKTAGKNGICYEKHAAYCFETQAFPNAVNIPHFPNTVLRGGEVFQSKTEFRFGVE
jgi:aldose 1-epimerase